MEVIQDNLLLILLFYQAKTDAEICVLSLCSLCKNTNKLFENIAWINHYFHISHISKRLTIGVCISDKCLILSEMLNA